MRRVVLDLTGAELASIVDGIALNLDAVKDVVEWQVELRTHATSGITSVTVGAVRRHSEPDAYYQMLSRSIPGPSATPAFTHAITAAAGTIQQTAFVTEDHKLVRQSTIQATFAGAPHATDRFIVTANWR